jgi:hypothetical protein
VAKKKVIKTVGRGRGVGSGGGGGGLKFFLKSGRDIVRCAGREGLAC